MIDPLRHIRRLTTILIVSGALNIALGALFFYYVFRERPPTPFYEQKPANRQEQQSPLAIDHCNNEVIRCFRRMPIEWLVSRLSNIQLVENGYTQRDLALASLVAFHHFDIERALSGLSKVDQKRTIVYGKYRNGTSAEIIVFPGLSEDHYNAIASFAKMEKYPLTTKGLFLALSKDEGSHDLMLADAFFMTSDFLSVEMLFGRGDVSVDKAELLEVLLQGNWTMLSTFLEQQKSSQDLSPARRQRFLLDYIQQESKAAAYLMLKTDFEVASRKLDDNHAMLLLKLIESKSPEAEKFALSLLTSPRSDAVWKLAAERLYGYAGETMPENSYYHAALSRFVPQNTIIPIAAPKKNAISDAPPIAPPIVPSISVKPSFSKQSNRVVSPDKLNKIPLKPSKLALQPVKRDRTYIVQEGDSLWKISRRFNVDVQVIRSYNKLDSDFLRPGTPIRIP